MFRNFLLIAIRNMRRYKLYSAINLAGLAVGIACCLMIGLLIVDELQYDRFHQYADRIYRFSTWNNASTFAHLGPKLVADFPDIEHAVRITRVSIAGTPMAYRDPGIFRGRTVVCDLELLRPILLFTCSGRSGYRAGDAGCDRDLQGNGKTLLRRR